MPESFGSSHRIRERGQAFLIIVLIMIIALTIGLSVASRSVTNLKLSTEEENSQKAFSAAEAGIEQYLQSPTQNLNVNQSFTTSGATILSLNRTWIGGGTNNVLLNNGNAVNQNDGADIWFTPYNTNPALLYTSTWNNGRFTVYWGNNGTAQCSDAAIEVIVITAGSSAGKTDGNLVLNKYAIENGCSNGRSSGFTAPQAGTTTIFSGINFPYGYTFPSPSGTYGFVVYARVIPLFANTRIGVYINSGPTFPSTGQGQLITSSGQAGSAQRQLQYFESWDSIPSSLLFSALSSQ